MTFGLYLEIGNYYDFICVACILYVALVEKF